MIHGVYLNFRIRYRSREEDRLYGTSLNGEPVCLHCREEQWRQLSELEQALHEGSLLQLLNVTSGESSGLHCEFIILEPDYLIDISTLAECFRPFGHHPLNYLLSRFRSPQNTRHILLGNAANFFIDELVNEREGEPVDYTNVLQGLFKASPFEFSACEDLKDKAVEAEFFSSCKDQFSHIRRVIDSRFPDEGIDREKLVVEPSFISSLLGVQGRLDLMAQDFSAFLELKSGKAEEDFPSRSFKYSSIHHYTQMILYLAVLEFNLRLPHHQVRSYLLYSRYPVLSREGHSRQHLRDVLHLRNRIVALEYLVQAHNSSAYTDRVLSCIRAERLNTKKMSGRFFEQYLSPQINELSEKLRSLDEQERAFFMRVYTFIVKEMWHAKVGLREYEGEQRPANLWNAPEEEKIAAGEFLYGLRILENKADDEEHCVTLSLPEYEQHYMPNFRPGDAIVLYQWEKGRGLGEAQVFKGSIDNLSSERLTIRLRIRQRNKSVLPDGVMYAVEHDYMDVTFTGMFKGLTAFADARPDRRDLLLGRRRPESEAAVYQPDNQSAPETSLERVVRKALSATDCFLLIGPPGTGKTSQALKRMVASLHAEGKTILLLSYTNRAVDEICGALTGMDDAPNFIRLGGELNCDPVYRPYLLDKQLKHCNRRSDVRELIESTSIVVATVASAWNKPDLFRLKHFDVAIVDEATQLLEPHLLGVLSVKDGQGRNAVERFILIGDHKQLPAVILQSDEESRVDDACLQDLGLRNLKESLFERLYRGYRERGWEHAYDMLDRQGRMHPGIARFASDCFYEGKLQALGLPHQLPDSPLLSPFPRRMLFFPSQRSVLDQSDKINSNEAAIIVDYLSALCAYYREQGLSPDCQSIGIITPYRSQIALIRRAIREAGIERLPDISIDTVERFQGGQKDIILYSFCLNADWQLKALPNCMEENGKLIDRKLNVVMTRARKQMVVIGNKHFLLQNELYASLVRLLEQEV